MRIAFYNIQNLFFRHQDMLREQQSRNVRNWIHEMDNLVSKVSKGPRELNRIRELSFLLHFDKVDKSRYALMKARGGKLYLNSLDYPTMEKACRNNHWNGWIELLNIPLDPISVFNKARLIAEVQADVLVLQEVEDRSSVVEFNNKFLPEYPGTNYSEIIVIPSPTVKGLEQALLLKKGNRVRRLQIHSEKKARKGQYLFDRGCAVFEIFCGENMKVCIISAQFIKSGENREDTDAFRLLQAKKIIEIYHELQSAGMKHIILAGTLNAYSYCYSLAPLFQQTDLKNICSHPGFNSPTDTRNSNYHRLGGYGKGINIRQRNYFLVSPELYFRIEKTGINRKGIWPGNDSQWMVYRSIKKKENQASQHPLLWMDVNI